MQFLNVPAAPNNPVIMVRVDYWDEASKSYPAENAFIFYQTGSQVQPRLTHALWTKHMGMPHTQHGSIECLDLDFGKLALWLRSRACCTD